MKTFRVTVVIIIVSILVVSLLVGCGGGCIQTVSRSLCIERQRNVYHAILVYTGDWDGAMPWHGSWQDSISPYVGIEQVNFVCPQIELHSAGQYGIAFNTKIVGLYLASVSDPSSYSCVFDSTILTRNAESTSSTVPNPTRHDGNVILRLDGAAVSTPPPN